MKGFFKDHDFVEIQMEGETFYSDASFSDVLGYNLETDANNPSHLTCSLMMSLFVIALILFCLSVYFYGKGRLKTSAIFAITLATWWVVSALITAVNMYGMPGGYLADALYVLWIISPLLAIFAIWKTRFFQSKTTRLLLTVAAVILFLASPFIWGAGALFSDPGPVNSAYLRHYDIPAYVN